MLHPLAERLACQPRTSLPLIPRRLNARGRSPVLVVVSLLAFVGSVSVARYIGGMLLRARSEDGRDLGLPVAAEEREAGS